MNEGIDTLEQMLNEVESLLEDYWKQYGQPLPMRLLAAKFGKRARRFGGNFKGMLLRDSRFLVDMDRNAAYRVSLCRRAGLNMILTVTLKRNGGSLPLEALESLMTAQGFSRDAVSSAIDYLIGIGSLSLIAGNLSVHPDL